jgi:hypothetical protein
MVDANVKNNIAKRTPHLLILLNIISFVSIAKIKIISESRKCFIIYFENIPTTKDGEKE